MTPAQPPIDPATAEATAAAFRGLAQADAEVWARTCMTWKDAFGVVHVGLSDPTEVQLQMFEHDRACKLAHVPCRMLVYKSRRMGASTGAQGIIYHRLQNRPNLTCKLMANTDKTAGEVSDIFKLMAKRDRFPWPGLKGSPVVQDISGRTTLANNSVYVDLSARGEEPGRGGAAQLANLTEAGHYTETGDPVGGFLPSVQAALTSEVGLIIVDTTPGPPAGFFYEMCLLALEREANKTQTLNDYKLIFVPWWKGKDATKAFASDAQRAEFMGSLKEDEVLEWENHDPERKVITPEHMHWRRMIINDVLKGSVELFRIEYASSVREGFMRAARHCFNLREMQRGYEAARGCHPIKVGAMSLLDGNTKAVFIHEEHGATKIYEDPTYGNSFVCAWDTMTGSDQVGTSTKSNPDWHSIVIIRAEIVENGIVYPPRLVASHKSRLPIEVAAAEAHALSLYYGGCLILPEVNNSGLAGVKALEALGANIFQRKTGNVTTSTVETANGWMTTEVTRKTIIAILAQAIRTRTFDCPELEFWQQALNFIVDPKKGRPEALSGQKDDLILSVAIALANLGAATRMDLPTRRKITESDLRRRGGVVLPDGTRISGYR